MRRWFFTLFIQVLFVFQHQSLYGDQKEIYQLSMLPGYSPEQILNRISPLAEYLSGTVVVEPHLTVDYDQYLKELNDGIVDVGFHDSYIYVLASKNHQVIGMAVKGEAGDRVRGVIIARAGGPIKSFGDLKGKRVGFVSFHSAEGFLSQKIALLQSGIDVEKDVELVEAVENKQENVVFAVYSGDVDAGFVQESALNSIQKFIPINTINIVARTQWLPGWVISIKRTAPDSLKDELRKKLLQLKKGAPVLEALKIDGFRLAEDSEFSAMQSITGID